MAAAAYWSPTVAAPAPTIEGHASAFLSASASPIEIGFENDTPGGKASERRLEPGQLQAR